MEAKELKIQIPEGYCIDESKSTFEKIVFKKKDTKPRSWEEYCLNIKRNSVFWISGDSSVENVFNIDGSTLIPSFDKNTLPTKELAEAFLAMMQLISLRQAWIGDWEPDWRSNVDCDKYCIIGIYCNFEVHLLKKCRYPLSFPTKEMAEDFIDCFKDLLETAKPLI